MKIHFPICALLLAPLCLRGPCNAQNAPDSSTLSIATAARVYPRTGFASRMIGGEIQGSNDSATGGFVTLATIKAAPEEGDWTQIELKNAKPYRFLRYFGPSGSYSNIAELEFLHDKKRIEGKPYGTFGSRDNLGNDYAKAFDGDVKTFFDAVAADSQYLGIEINNLAPSAPVPSGAPVVIGDGLRTYHIGNSLTDGMGEYTRQLALAAGFKDAWMDRQTIPGAPLYLNYQSDGGFGTPYRKAFADFAPITDLVMQTFISNGDSENPEFSLKFYNDARVNSPQVRPWIYGQWDATGSGSKDSGTASWKERNEGLMRVYMTHAINFNELTKDKKTAVIPGGLGLINLKEAFDTGKIPGNEDFFPTIFADALHLTENGRQFIGMVIFSTLYDQSPVGLPIVKINDNGPQLTDEQNRVYQQVAWDTVQSFKKDRGASLAYKIPGEIDARAFVRSNIPLRNSRLGNIDENASFSYLLNAPNAGHYSFSASAITDHSDKNLDVFVNHQPAGSVMINPKKDAAAADSTALTIELKAGLNLLRILVPYNRTYDLNSLKIVRVGESLENTMPIFDLSAWEDEIKPGDKLVRDFSVFDAESETSKLKIAVASDNEDLLPASALKVETGEFKNQWGGMATQRLTVTPKSGQTGESNVLVTVTDEEGLSRKQSFKVKVK